MKIKFNQLKSKKYLLLLIFIMLVNTILTVTLLRVSFSQTRKNDFLSQRSVKAAVMEQKDCPLRITIVSVDNASPNG